MKLKLIILIVAAFCISAYSPSTQDENELKFELDGNLYKMKVKDISLSKSDKIRISISAEGETSQKKSSVHLFFDLDDNLTPDKSARFGFNLNEILKTSTVNEMIRLSISDERADYRKSTSEKRIEYDLKGSGELKITNVFAGKGVVVIGKFSGSYSTKDMTIKLRNGEFKFRI